MRKRSIVAIRRNGNQLCFADPSQDPNAVDPEVRQEIEAVLVKFGPGIQYSTIHLLSQLYTRRTRFSYGHGRRKAPVASGQQAIEKRYAVMLSSSPGEFVGQVVEVYPIGNEMSVITKDSEGTLWKGYKAWICVRDADTWKIRMEYVN